MSQAQNPYNYYGTYQPRVQTTLGLKGRPVSSIEEARAANIDFDGSTFYFPDLATGRIYTKQINMDGTANFAMYEKTQLPPPSMAFNTTDYVTKDEFTAVIKELKDSFLAGKSSNQKQISDF